MSVEFSTYLLFMPDASPGPNIYVPLRKVSWSLNDEAANGVYVKGNPINAPQDDGCSDFPHWESVFGDSWF